MQGKLGRAGQRMPDNMRRQAHRAAYLVQRSAKQNLTGGRPLNVREGLLRSSVVVGVRGGGRDVEASIGTNIIYGAVHEKGKVIHAKRNYMVFNVGGRWVKTRVVRIPERPWLRPALERNRQRIVQLLDEGVKATIREAGL